MLLPVLLRLVVVVVLLRLRLLLVMMVVLVLRVLLLVLRVAVPLQSIRSRDNIVHAGHRRRLPVHLDEPGVRQSLHGVQGMIRCHKVSHPLEPTKRDVVFSIRIKHLRSGH